MRQITLIALLLALQLTIHAESITNSMLPLNAGPGSGFFFPITTDSPPGLVPTKPLFPGAAVSIPGGPLVSKIIARPTGLISERLRIKQYEVYQFPARKGNTFSKKYWIYSVSGAASMTTVGIISYFSQRSAYKRHLDLGNLDRDADYHVANKLHKIKLASFAAATTFALVSYVSYLVDKPKAPGRRISVLPGEVDSAIKLVYVF